MKSIPHKNGYVVRIDKGEEIVAILKEFCTKNNITSGKISGIGATNKVTIGLFESIPKKYSSQEFKGDYEIAPLLGNISTLNGEVYLHLHINIADNKQRSFGGHLNSAIVSVTFECVIDVFDSVIERDFSEEIGINLIR